MPRVGVRRRRGSAGSCPAPVRFRRTGAAFATCAALVLAASGCTESTAGDLRFPGSAPSLTQLGRSALDAAVVGDTARLGRLRLTETEHNEVVWPHLPAAAPEVGMPVDLVWADIERRNVRALDRIVPALEGRRLNHVDTSCRGPVRSFGAFEVLTDCWVVFDAADQAAPGPVALPRYEVQLFKDVLLREGGYKVFRFYEGAPRSASARAVP